MNDISQHRKRVLDPVERFSEILFGLIMVLSFTGTLSATGATSNDVLKMLVGAVGCNFAWGLIDAVMYLMGCLASRSANLSTLRAVRTERSPGQARQILRDALPPAVASIMQPTEIDHLHERILALPDPPARPNLTTSDWRGAFGVFLLVFLATFPVTLPFIFMTNAVNALRTSNGIALIMLFALGYALGKSCGSRPIHVGLAMVVVGILLVGLTIALGG